MEKYGVVQTDPEEKTAEDKPRCPNCGAELDDRNQTGVSLCPGCGTEPFEPRNEK